MKLVLFLLRSSRTLVILAVLAGIVAGACNSALIALVNRALATQGATSETLLLAFAALWVLLPLTRVVSSSLLIRLAQKSIFDLRLRLSGRILAAPFRKLEEVGTARLLSALTDDVRVITSALISVPALCIQVAIILGCMVYLWLLSWQVFVIVAVLLAVSMGTIQIPTRWAHRAIRLARDTQDALFLHLRGLTEGSKELKLHGRRRQDFLDAELGGTAAEYQRHNVKGNTLYAVAGSWGQFLFFGALGALLFLLPRWIPVGREVLSGYVLTLIYMMVPLDVVFDTLFPTLARANVALRKIESLGISLESGPAEAVAGNAPQPDWQRLELAGVTHAFPGERAGTSFTLGPLDLELRPGEVIFLTGGNGSGKTTLAKILTGLYVPETGEIRLDGVPVTDANRDAYRQRFSAVFSDFFLFQNLLGLESPSLDEDARRYLERLQLAEKVRVEGGRLSTTDLSQGQRKRLALLIAYLEDRPIYLFDEWAADQDPAFKSVFYFEILPELKARGKTVIAITHDDRYFHLGDRVVKLDTGRLEYDLSGSEVARLRPLAGVRESTALPLSGIAS